MPCLEYYTDIYSHPSSNGPGAITGNLQTNVRSFYKTEENEKQRLIPSSATD